MYEQPSSLIATKKAFAEYASEPAGPCAMSKHRAPRATENCDCTWCTWRRGFDEHYDAMMLEYRKYKHDVKSIERKDKRLETKSDVFQQLGGRCVGCGLVPSDLAVIDFHEPDGRIVRGRIPSDFLNSPNKKKMLEIHLLKIVPLCSNCHRILHFGHSDVARGVGECVAIWREHRDAQSS